MDNPEEMDRPEGFRTHDMFDDAYLAGDRIYLVSWDRWEKPVNKQILVLDTKDLKVVDRYLFPVSSDERFYSLAVAPNGGKERIYAIIDTEKNDICLVELN